MKKQWMSVCVLAMTMAMLNGCGKKAATVTNTAEPTNQIEETVEATQTVEETEQPQQDVAGYDTKDLVKSDRRTHEDAISSQEKNIETATKQPVATQEASNTQKQDKKNTKKAKKTLEGEFMGFADGSSVEISLEDGVRVFRIGNDASNKALSKLEEGERFIFEVETAKDIDTIVKVFE